MFGGVGTAYRKIQRVIDGFRKMVDDLDNGIQTLLAAIDASEQDITTLEVEIKANQEQIEKAKAIRLKLIELLG